MWHTIVYQWMKQNLENDVIKIFLTRSSENVSDLTDYQR
jgi:hypothetical protein